MVKGNGVIAYTYDAAAHCPGCSLLRFGMCPRCEDTACTHDEDREGNTPGAVMVWDERNPDGERCDDCHGWIYPPFCGDCGRDFGLGTDSRMTADCDHTDDE